MTKLKIEESSFSNTKSLHINITSELGQNWKAHLIENIANLAKVAAIGLAISTAAVSIDANAAPKQQNHQQTKVSSQPEYDVAKAAERLMFPIGEPKAAQELKTVID